MPRSWKAPKVNGRRGRTSEKKAEKRVKDAVLKELGTDPLAIDDVFSGLSSDREGRGWSRPLSKTGERKQCAYRGKGFSWLALRSARVKLSQRKNGLGNEKCEKSKIRKNDFHFGERPWNGIADLRPEW